ncbi:uncharacterized protein LOC132303099 [Cornus florida]|uniref:uncharacterized protein LOC132303099 n=1 Tax=Cornus florida TaxID=4283 RepID=UPI00289E6D30|nr:uncharacterized protein LOC132303099 [Cornus florida]
MEEGQSSSPIPPAIVPSRNPNPSKPKYSSFFDESQASFKNLQYHPECRGTKVSITNEDVAEEVAYWRSSVIGYVMGKKSYYPYFKNFVEKYWSKDFTLVYLKDGFFMVQFKTDDDVQKVLSRIHTFEGWPIELENEEKGELKSQKATSEEIIRSSDKEQDNLEGLEDIRDNVAIDKGTTNKEQCNKLVSSGAIEIDSQGGGKSRPRKKPFIPHSDRLTRGKLVGSGVGIYMPWHSKFLF